MKQSSPIKAARYACVLIAIVAGIFSAGCGRRANDSPSAQNATSATASGNSSLLVEETISPAGKDSREPELTFTPDGRIIMSWVEKVDEKRYALRFATRDGAGWSEPRTVAEGDNWFVNWADFPSVIVLTNSELAAHWLVKSGSGTYAYDVNISRSKDGGKTWSKAITPHTDRTQTEHGFASLLPLIDGRLGVVWVDGRNLKDIKADEDEGPLPESMTLRYATVDALGKLSDEAMLDERICECCQTSAAVTSEGAIIAYRDRSEREVRDIYVVRQEKGKWSAPQPVHTDGWEIMACPVNGPSVAADGQRVAVAWYTEASDNPRVQVAFSSDGGRTFGSPVHVDDGSPVGRVDVLLLPDGSALVCWMAGTAEKGATKMRRIQQDGTLGAVSIVAESDIARSSGFPRMARLGGDVFIAWTQFGKPSTVRVVKANLEFK